MLHPSDELVVVRESHIPRKKLFAAWLDGKTYPEWFCPKPWYDSGVKLDVRTGGGRVMIFHGPGGEKFPNKGVFLD